MSKKPTRRYQIIPGDEPNFIGRAGWIIATAAEDPNDQCKGCYLKSRGINCGCLCTNREYINNHLKVNFHRIADGDIVKDTKGKVWSVHQRGEFNLNLIPNSRGGLR